ncbi:MAG: lysophospholipase [Ruminococcaceae bacterium]|nr:lysophospholipase [Oscillospiraceae bacterium]
MKVLFFGDSITDAGRETQVGAPNVRLGYGYVTYAAGKLLERDPGGFEIYNRGISGHRVVDLYARVKKDCWNLEPDVISILIGINDIWHEASHKNGVELDRFEKVYRMLLEDTKKKLPNAKLIICEPFMLEGTATAEKMEYFSQVKEYAKVAKKLSEEFGAEFVPLQDKYDEAGAKYGNDTLLSDGVHPTLAGAVILANEWMKAFDRL